MRIRILRYIAIFVIISSCTQTVINIKQAEASQNTLTNKDIQEIQKVWEKFLKGFADRDIDSSMETISPNYSRSIDGTTIDYAGLKAHLEKTSADFFDNNISCSINDIKILKSDITDNKVTIEFEYKLYAFNKNSMQWVIYRTANEAVFFKENGEWKIITTGVKKQLN